MAEQDFKQLVAKRAAEVDQAELEYNTMVAEHAFNRVEDEKFNKHIVNKHIKWSDLNLENKEWHIAQVASMREPLDTYKYNPMTFGGEVQNILYFMWNYNIWSKHQNSPVMFEAMEIASKFKV